MADLDELRDKIDSRLTRLHAYREKLSRINTPCVCPRCEDESNASGRCKVCRRTFYENRHDLLNETEDEIRRCEKFLGMREPGKEWVDWAKGVG